LALPSPTSGGRSVGIVHSRTQAMEFSFAHILAVVLYNNSDAVFENYGTIEGFSSQRQEVLLLNVDKIHVLIWKKLTDILVS
jgi:hypothetical protein